MQYAKKLGILAAAAWLDTEKYNPEAFEDVLNRVPGAIVNVEEFVSAFIKTAEEGYVTYAGADFEREVTAHVTFILGA